MGEYYKPVKSGKVNTRIMINNYRTENPVYFDDDNVLNPAKMNIELDFYSTDYSLEKFDVFMKKFVDFLETEGYLYKKTR